MAQNMTASRGRHTTHSISIRQDQEDTRRLLSIPSTQYRGGDGACVGVLYRAILQYSGHLHREILIF